MKPTTITPAQIAALAQREADRKLSGLTSYRVKPAAKALFDWADGAAPQLFVAVDESGRVLAGGVSLLRTGATLAAGRYYRETGQFGWVQTWQHGRNGDFGCPGAPVRVPPTAR